jgi:AcrR family transcriptional regulator
MASRVRAGERRSGSGVAPRVQIEEIQRARLTGAAVEVLDELGYTATTVAHITEHAGVSRRTFYDLFDNCEDCLLAALESVLAQLGGELAAAHLGGLAWRERVRMGLWTILCFFDGEPALARICVVQSARGSERVLERREEVLAALAAVIDEGREGARGDECLPLTAEGLVGAAVSILNTRLLRANAGRGSRSGQRPLTDLLGELMGMIVLPYLGAAAARRERVRPAPVLPRPIARGTVGGAVGVGVAPALRDVPIRLTYRTVRVLEDVAVHPGVNNRVLADHVGIADQGQVSKLVARLERVGLLENTGTGHTKGGPNAWRLTSLGRRFTQSIGTHLEKREQAA